MENSEVSNGENVLTGEVVKTEQRVIDHYRVPITHIPKDQENALQIIRNTTSTCESHDET
jgi:hypothetical protein